MVMCSSGVGGEVVKVRVRLEYWDFLRSAFVGAWSGKVAYDRPSVLSLTEKFHWQIRDSCLGVSK